MYLSQASGIYKGRDFTFGLVKIYKSIGKSVIACCKKGYLKWFTDAFCGCEKVKKTRGLVIHSYLKILSVYSS